MLKRTFIVATAFLLTIGGAHAATVSIAVSDLRCRPVPDAIVILVDPSVSHISFSILLPPQSGMKHMHMDY